MNFKEFIGEALALADPWPPQVDETSPHPGLTHDPARVNVERAKLAHVDQFIPTGFEKIDALVRNLRPSIRYDMRADSSPYYLPADDTIHLPPPGAFISSEAYARTLVHEMSHWTKATNRLNRQEIPEDAPFEWLFLGVPVELRAKEEFVAELTAAAVMEKLAPTSYARSYSLNYIYAWARNLKVAGSTPEEATALVTNASNEAEKASRYLLSAVGE